MLIRNGQLALSDGRPFKFTAVTVHAKGTLKGYAEPTKEDNLLGVIDDADGNQFEVDWFMNVKPLRNLCQHQNQ